MMYIKRKHFDQFYKTEYVVKKSKRHNLIAYPQELVEVSKYEYYKQPESLRMILPIPTRRLH